MLLYFHVAEIKTGILSLLVKQDELQNLTDLNCKFKYLEKAGLLYMYIHIVADYRALTNKIRHHVQVGPRDLLVIYNALVNFKPHPRASPHPRWGFDINTCPHPWGS